MYALNADYNEKPEWVVEDADLFFNSVREANYKTLTPWHFVSGKTVAPATARCTISNGSEEKYIDIKCEQKMNRIECSVVGGNF